MQSLQAIVDLRGHERNYRELLVTQLALHVLVQHAADVERQGPEPIRNVASVKSVTRVLSERHGRSFEFMPVPLPES